MIFSTSKHLIPVRKVKQVGPGIKFGNSPVRSKLLAFEKTLNAPHTVAAMVLGVSHSSYMKYRCEAEPLPRVVEFSIEALRLVPEERRGKLVRRRARG
jgi:hypothetical protein